MTKRTLLTVLTIGLLVSLSGVAASSALADDEEFNNPIIKRLSEAFGVDEDEVEAVFDAVKEEHHQEMLNQKESRLQQAVEDGVITQAQLDALRQKHQQMWEERKQEREEHHQEMEAWFQEEGIDHEALMEYMGGFGYKEGFGMKGQHRRSHE